MQKTPVKVLVIDDDQDDFLMLKDLLAEVQDHKFELEWASSYEMGKQSLSKKTHEICFLDYRLGAKTGLDLLKEVLPEECKIPIILLTGYGEHDVDLEAMQVGAADYLVKDQITSTVLERSIRYSIHRTQSRDIQKQMVAQIMMQDRLASVGLLASSLAHEIGTPLGVIRGRAEYLAIQTQDAPQIKKNVDIIVSQIDRVTNLIRSLLNLARGDEIRQSREVNLSQIVAEVLDLMGHELRKHAIEIRNLLGTQIPIQVRAEAQPLHQVLLNLLVNSVHAIDSAIRSGRTAPHFIRITAHDLEERCVLSIEDTGCGISEKNMKNLFKPFFTTKGIGFGTGLGLATSYRIIESWGGTIQVESQEDVGTVFKISIPKK
jgi:signal transduction histidine kinase